MFQTIYYRIRILFDGTPIKQMLNLSRQVQSLKLQLIRKDEEIEYLKRKLKRVR